MIGRDPPFLLLVNGVGLNQPPSGSPGIAVRYHLPQISMLAVHGAIKVCHVGGKEAYKFDLGSLSTPSG